MRISASIINEGSTHTVVARTNENEKTLTVTAKPVGGGSSVNGGEFLCIALATCFCNDLYREATKRGMKLIKVSVDAWSEFGAEGEAGQAFGYRAQVDAEASKEEISALIIETDRVAEIQKTLRTGVEVKLVM